MKEIDCALFLLKSKCVERYLSGGVKDKGLIPGFKTTTELVTLKSGVWESYYFSFSSLSLNLWTVLARLRNLHDHFLQVSGEKGARLQPPGK